MVTPGNQNCFTVKCSTSSTAERGSVSSAVTSTINYKSMISMYNICKRKKDNKLHFFLLHLAHPSPAA